MKKPVSIEIKPSRHFPFVSRHPWAHTSSLVDSQTSTQTGDVVDLVTHDGSWVARGLFNADGKIRVRLYSWDPGQCIDDAFFCEQIDQAITLREQCGLHPHFDAVRLVFSEADGISGLIVDRYRDFLIVQVTAAVIAQRIDCIVDHLQSRLSPQAIVIRVDESTAKAEGIAACEEIRHGEAPGSELTVVEHGIEYSIDLMHSQKTGLYLDQRDNRRIASSYVTGDVLDVCTYVGGFALNAALSDNVNSVRGIDTSQKVVDIASRNAQQNGISKVSFEQGDCFEYLETMKREQQSFDSIILDPPRFAGSRQKVDAAMRAYSRLNRSAVELLPRGGRLVTCSCSGRVSSMDFGKMLTKVSRQTGRDIIVLERRGAAVDHPVRLSCPETDYLKCVICEVR